MERCINEQCTGPEISCGRGGHSNLPTRDGALFIFSGFVSVVVAFFVCPFPSSEKQGVHTALILLHDCGWYVCRFSPNVAVCSALNST